MKSSTEPDSELYIRSELDLASTQTNLSGVGLDNPRFAEGGALDWRRRVLYESLAGAVIPAGRVRPHWVIPYINELALEYKPDILANRE